MVEREMSEYDLYMYVIEDVINSIRSVFIEDGKDELTLQDLKELWVEKLKKSNAVDPAKKSQSFSRVKSASPAPQSPLINVRLQIPQATSRPITCTHLLAQKNIVPASTRQSQSGRMVVVHNPTNSTVTGQQCVRLPPSVGQTLTLFQTQPNLLPQAVVGNQTAILNVQQLRGQSSRPLQIVSQVARPLQQHQIFLPSPRIIQIQPLVQRQPSPALQPSTSGLLNLRFRSPANGQIVLSTPQSQPPQLASNSIIRLNSSSLSAPAAMTRVVVQRAPVGANLVSPQVIQRLRQVDGTASSELMDDGEDDEDDEEAFAALSDSDQEAISEDVEESIPLDDVHPPTMDEIEEMMDCDNLLLCLYKKVEKKKERFKMILNFGILSIGGRENVFMEASGIADLKVFH